MPRKKVVIVGAGPGGLTSAMILAHRGFDVHVYEKNDHVGGRNARLTVNGVAFDLGPTFLMMKCVVDEMFAEAGYRSDDLLEFQPLDPMYQLRFTDKTLNLSHDPAKMRAEIARHFPGQEGGFDRFLKREAARFEHLYPCLQKDYNHFSEFFNPIFLRAIPHIPVGISIFDYLGRYFDPDKLRLAFTFQAKYLGMSPWECPGAFLMIPYVEQRYGLFHVKGGLSHLSEAMADVAVSHGATIHLNAPVKQFVVQDKAVKGITLQNGETVLADETIVNADFGYAMTHLMPPGVLKKYTPERVAKKQYSCSTFMLYLALDTVYPQIPHHTIVFANDYKSNVENIFTTRTLTDDCSFYVRNASLTDETLAPKGMSGFYVLVPVPNQKSDIDWKQEGPLLRERILTAMEERLHLPDLRSHIIGEHMVTPDTWEKEMNVYLGATFNLAHTLSQMLYFRPHNTFEELDQCYLVGGGTHPGSGLPTIYESGRITANLICKKHQVPFKPPSILPPPVTG